MPYLIVGLTYQVMTACFLTVCSDMLPKLRLCQTNAKVEVRQQGNLIYQTTVTPGSFEINDLYPTGFGGELQVSIYETNGEIQKFSIPYASVVEMLRPKMSRYSLLWDSLEMPISI